MSFAHVFLHRGTVGLARTVIFLALVGFALASGVQAATDVRILQEERLLGIFGLGVVGSAGEAQAARAQTGHQATQGSRRPFGEIASIRVLEVHH